MKISPTSNASTEQDEVSTIDIARETPSSWARRRPKTLGCRDDFADRRQMALGSDFDRVLTDAKAGLPPALGFLYREFNPGLRRFLVARLPREGEDLAADVWVAVAPKIRTFTGDERHFRAWLFTFGRRRLIDHFRRNAARGPVLALCDHEDPPGLDDPESEALARLSAAEAAQLLIKELTADQCNVLMLRIYGGLDAGEVATAMGHTDTWVRVTQHRALQRLRQRLDSKVDVMQ